MVDRSDYYAVLGVPRDADSLTIKKAFRRLAVEHHPDRHGGDAQATVHLQTLVSAYEALGNSENRRRYDEGIFTPLVSIEPSTPIEELFGRLVDQLFGVRTQQAINGADYEYRLEVDLKDVAKGCQSTVSLPVEVECEGCGGRGFPPGTLPQICARCGGQGEIQRRRQLRSGLEICPDCQGRCYTFQLHCSHCKGLCVVTGRQSVDIVVPPGIENGDSLLIREAGQPGRNGGIAGNCIVRVTVKAHPILERRGLDIWMERHITVFQAMVGQWLVVPTLKGNKRIRMPTPVASGQVLRLEGHGIKQSTGQDCGDQYVTLHVEMPEGLSPHDTEQLRELSKRIGLDGFPLTRRAEQRVVQESEEDTPSIEEDA